MSIQRWNYVKFDFLYKISFYYHLKENPLLVRELSLFIGGGGGNQKDIKLLKKNAAIPWFM